MRFLIYILIIVSAVSFSVYRWDKTTGELPVPVSPLTPVSSTSTPLTEPPDPLPPLSPLSAPLTPSAETAAPPVKLPPALDPAALKQIQDQIDQTEDILKDIQKQTSLPAVRFSQQELHGKAASRVVNFFCQQGSQIRVASGVIISPRGHILTNAHVAEGFDNNFECAIRQGSPARNLGYAKIAVFPGAYTAAATRQEQAENDVSIWRLTRLANGDPLPETMDYYSIDPTYYPQIDQSLSTFSYPSELLGYETILKSLNMFFAETIVNDFDRDLILSSTGLSSQVGSSGGILVDVYTNQFAGLIFAVSKDEEIAKRKLFSLTPFSINRVVQTETGLSLSAFLDN